MYEIFNPFELKFHTFLNNLDTRNSLVMNIINNIIGLTQILNIKTTKYKWQF